MGIIVFVVSVKFVVKCFGFHNRHLEREAPLPRSEMVCQRPELEDILFHFRSALQLHGPLVTLWTCFELSCALIVTFGSLLLMFLMYLLFSPPRTLPWQQGCAFHRRDLRINLICRQDIRRTEKIGDLKKTCMLWRTLKLSKYVSRSLKSRFSELTRHAARNTCRFGSRNDSECDIQQVKACSHGLVMFPDTKSCLQCNECHWTLCFKMWCHLTRHIWTMFLIYASY